MTAIRKAVFPVAGLGTRFMPATKAVPKEMLPVLDRPLIDYAMAEARAAGIETFIFITGREVNARILNAFFEMPRDLEAALREKNPVLADRLRSEEPPPGSTLFIPQGEPLGLGHAVWCAREVIGDEPFAVLLPDDLMDCPDSCIGQLMAVAERTGGNAMAIESVPLEQTRRYGVIDPGAVQGRQVEVRGLVEKPSPDEAPSTLSVVGRYVLHPEIFSHLERFDRGAGGEIQLTDAIAATLGERPCHGVEFIGRRYDCGSRQGFLEAQLGLALRQPELRSAMLRFLRDEGDIVG